MQILDDILHAISYISTGNKATSNRDIAYII